MKSVVIFKWAVKPEDIRVKIDGSIDWSAAPPWVGDDDYVAAQVACQAAGPEGEVVGLTLADGDVAFAAARGAGYTVALENTPLPASVLCLARTLAAAVRDIGDVGVVTVGDSDWEPALPSFLAGLLGWPALMAVDSVAATDGALRVTRRFAAYTQEVTVAGPVLLGVQARREEKDKPGLKAVLTARKKPVKILKADELGGFEAEPSLISLGSSLPETAPARLISGAEPERAVGELLQALRNEGVL
ncbi:MAG: electron transfer flavoprotein subunit alpha [Gracilibacteraceae bacterium]|jgi:electron transfer flavoprotein beta subunit|nr:electron transfer flavoprotein subunit alpha [Gracilibacteraceae bacterium]